MSRCRPAIDALAPYVPGEQPTPGARVVKLNTNENPYPPSPRALEALRAVDADTLRRYPAPFADEFREAAGSHLGVDPGWILPGNGSDDLLTLVMRAVTGPGRAVVYPVPTYVLYRTLAAIQETPTVEVPYDDAYALPVDGLAACDAALTIVANPNSPSGTAASVAELDRLARRLPGVLVLDEAYVEFAEASALELVHRHEHVMVLRTLSKSHGLAGLRLGYGIAQPALLTAVAKVKDSYNVDAIAARVGTAAIRDDAYTRGTTRRIVAARDRLTADLVALGFRVWPSQANFVLARPPDGNARRLYEGLRARHVLVRYFAEPPLAATVRISVGTDDEHRHLIAMLTELLT